MNMERLLNPEEVAELLGVTLKKMNQLAHDEELEHVQLSPRKRRFRLEHLNEYIDKRTVRSPRPVDKRPPRPVTCKTKGGEEKSVEDVGTDLIKEMRSL
jgi:excisionase family DNA binding protein